jgi:hypothetical protein
MDLMLFENDVEGALRAQAAGIHEFLVDWEAIGKSERQQGYDTEIKPGTADDLRALASTAGAGVWCRVNRLGSQSSAEIESAIDAGATGIFLPMVRSPSEAEVFLRCVNQRCAAGILVETLGAYESAATLANMRFDRVYFGLNDFAISRGGGVIFTALLDGSVERVREIFADTPFGFGGVTVSEAGDPVPCAFLIQEMARLDCRFSFLRRSFRRDIKGRNVDEEIQKIHAYWQQCVARDKEHIVRDRTRFHKLLSGICA